MNTNYTTTISSYIEQKEWLLSDTKYVLTEETNAAHAW